MVIIKPSNLALAAALALAFLWAPGLSDPQVTPLTTYPGIETEPSFSPDGTRLAFVWGGEKDDNRDIYVMRLGEGAPFRLTSDPARARGPVWSPDGSWIAFCRSTREGRNTIYVIPSDGGEVIQVTDQDGYRPLQSHDGRTLYYLRPGLTTTVPLFARPVAGGPERQVLESVRWCFWVVEGGIYYFAASDEDGSLPLRYYDFASGRSHLLTGLKGRGIWDLAASPDGKTVLFSAESPMRIDLMLVENFR